MPLSRGYPQVIPEPTDGGRVCLSDHGEQAGGSSTWSLLSLHCMAGCLPLRVSPCLSCVLLSHASPRITLPGVTVCARLLLRMYVHSCKGKRDAGCCDATATKNTDQANVSALSNLSCISVFILLFYSFSFLFYFLDSISSRGASFSPFSIQPPRCSDSYRISTHACAAACPSARQLYG
ncbi:hypothetical protein HDV62DRAFT_95249 [Trichoderma sp. SZMC 28011]